MERIGVAFSGGLSPIDIVECVRLAEELGYESAWMAEGHGGDQFSILTACAVATKEILLGTAITSIFVRSAPTIAMAAACVDYYSSGRFILGLGTSHKFQVEKEHGVGFSQPIQRLREYREIVLGLLHDGVISYSGDVLNIEGFDLWFEPVRREIPIYVAAVFPKMLEICGEIAQGVIPILLTVRSVRAAAEHVALGARRAGRDPKEVDMATLLPCYVSEDKEGNRDWMRGFLAYYAGRFPRYRRLMAEAGFPEEVEAVRQAWHKGDRAGAMKLVPSGLIDQISLVGGPEECRQRIRDYRDAGIDLPIIMVRATSGRDAKAQVMKAVRACAPM